MRTFHEDIQWVDVQTAPNTALANNTYYPLSTLFVDVSAVERVVFLIKLGTTAEAVTYQVRQDTSATVTGAVKALTSAVYVCGAGDAGKQATIDFSTKKLDAANGFKFVSLYLTGIAGTDYAAITCLLYRARILPVTQAANYPAANQIVLL
jgi:hypothetical protein